MHSEFPVLTAEAVADYSRVNETKSAAAETAADGSQSKTLAGLEVRSSP
ncbi:hypothetical protein AOX55_00004748 (plasmid) [Sinorhizobium fredii CCBAU 25509]|nr:hypothetical protein AOX55_00004748 [Sinorhizobium fredii CCBAU 25509]